MQEIWKIFKETNNRAYGRRIYEVSDEGNIKINGVIYDTSKQNRRYLNCAGKNIHRIVAETFIPNPYNKPCVDHINGNKHDNRAINLRWSTYSENVNNPSTKTEQFKRLRDTFSDNNYRVKLSKIRKKQMSTPEIRLKCSNNAKGNKICAGRRWVTNGEINKFVKPELVEQYIENGYHLGVTKNILY